MRPAGDSLFRALGRPEVHRAARAKAILRHWAEIVGDGLAERSRPDRWTNGVVWVAVTGSAWAQELRMRKDMILGRLNDLAGGEKGLFLDVRFGVRALPPAPVMPEVVSDEVVPDPDGDLTIREIAQRRLKHWPRRE